jgi:hypothetical protein
MFLQLVCLKVRSTPQLQGDFEMINPHLTAALVDEHRADLMKEASLHRQAKMARTTRSSALGPLVLAGKLVALAKGGWTRKSLPEPSVTLRLANNSH